MIKEEAEMKKDLDWLKNYVDETETTIKSLLDGATTHSTRISLKGSLATLKDFRGYINQLDEPEVLSQEEVDQAYKDGYEKGKQHTFYKGYLEGLADKENEPETVADVISDFWKSFERLKEVLGTEVEELEE